MPFYIFINRDRVRGSKMNKHSKSYKALFLILIVSLSLFSFTLVASADSNVLDRVVIIETKDNYDQGEAARMKERIGRIHPVIINALYERNLIIKFINFPLTDLPEYQFLRGETPRGWEGTGKTWDDVPGAGGSPAVARIGFSEPGEWHGTINLELHELAHLIDSHVFNYSSHTAEFTTIHKEEQAGFLPEAYFSNPEEYFAESFSYYYLGGERKSKLMQQAPKTFDFITKLPTLLSGGVEPEDKIVPEIILHGNNSIELNIGDVYEELGAAATDNIDGDLSNEIVITGVVNTAQSGQYTVTYSATDKAGNSATATRTVNVSEIAKELIPPVITLLGDNSIELQVGDLYKELGATAKDSAGGNLSEEIEVTGEVNTAEAGEYIVTYSVTDSNGNKATTSREVNVVKKESHDDIISPVIMLHGENPMELNLDDTYEEFGATAEDNVDGNLTNLIEVTGKINTSKPGKYMITYSVTDKAGNITTETRTVHVLDSAVLEVDSNEVDGTKDNTKDNDEIILNDNAKSDGGKNLKDDTKGGSKTTIKENFKMDGAALPLPSSSSNMRLLLVIGLLLTLSGSSMLIARKTA